MADNSGSLTWRIMMEMNVKGTTQPLLDGIHTAPKAENEPPFPAEHTGRLELSIPAIDKKAAFVFKLDLSDPAEVILSVRRADRETDPFIKLLPAQEGMIAKGIGFYILFNMLFETLERIWIDAAVRGKFYDEVPFVEHWEIAHNALHLIEPIFEDAAIQ